MALVLGSGHSDIPNSNQLQGNGKSIVGRKSANYHPPIWGDRFLKSSFDDLKPDALTQKRADELKEEVKRMLINVKDHLQELNLIDAIQRLGVAYHFEKEIADALVRIHNTYSDKEDDSDDLHTVSLRFRLLRQEGYNASPNVFNKFKDGEGSFKKSLVRDIQGLLSLYEVAYMGIRGEDVLDEARVFTTKHLTLALPHLNSPLSTLVELALELPLRKRVERLQSRYYISIYQQVKERDDTLLELAKLDFNLLQLLHQRELREISMWWKKCDFGAKLPFIRDRVVECYFWILGVYFEPQYSRARLMISRIISLTSVMDDIYDVYGTMEELKVFTEAIQRWDQSAIDQLPDYIRVHFCTLLDAVEKFEEELAREGKSYRISYLKEALEQMRGHLASCIQIYMKEHGSTYEEACQKFKRMAADAWKDINKECLKPTEVPMPLLMRAVNFARVIEVLYQYRDGYTNSTFETKDRISLVLVDPVPVYGNNN